MKERMRSILFRVGTAVAFAGCSLAAAASGPYIEIVPGVSAQANSCGASTTPASVQADISIPAGASYRYQVFAKLPAIPASSPYVTGSPEPYFQLLYASPVVNGPASGSNAPLSLDSPATWYSGTFAAVPNHSQMKLQVIAYSGPNGEGAAASVATLAWDCTTGQVLSLNNVGGPSETPYVQAPGVAASAAGPYIEIIPSVLAQANSCGASTTPASVSADISIPAGASYGYQVFAKLPAIPASSPYVTGSPEPYFQLLYASPVVNGPVSGSNTSLSLDSPATWYSGPYAAVPNNSQMKLLVTAYSGANGQGTAASVATLAWDCTTGQVLSLNNVGGPNETAAIPPYVQIVAAGSGETNTCAASATQASLIANIDIPAGTSYQYSLINHVNPEQPFSYGATDGIGGQYEPYDNLFYLSPVFVGPQKAANATVNLGTPMDWFGVALTLKPGTQLIAQINSYLTPYGDGPVAATATLTWNCTTGNVVSIANLGNASGPVAPVGTATITQAIEYYKQGADRYFLTTLAPEIAALDGPQSGWTRTGAHINVFNTAVAGAAPVCRYYLPPIYGDSHFYSSLPAECSALQSVLPLAILESANAFYVDQPDTTTGACPVGTVPIYRLWDGRPDVDHRYTTDATVAAQMVARGYIAEGYGPNAVSMCSPQ